jgi:hypothetical protein
VRAGFATEGTHLKRVQSEIETSVKETVRGAATTENNRLKSIETQLQAITKVLAELKASARASAQPGTKPKTETRPAQPANKEAVPVKEQEAK